MNIAKNIWNSDNQRDRNLIRVTVVALLLLILMFGLIGLGIWVMLILAAPFYLRWLALGNVLMTFVKEGTIKSILKGDQFDHLLMAFKGHHLNDPRKPWFDPSQRDWETIVNKPGETDEQFDDRSVLEKFIGAFWVGIPPFKKVRRARLQFTEPKIDSQGRQSIWPRTVITDFGYASDFTYVQVIEGAETTENIPFNLTLFTTVAMTNGYFAFHKTADYLLRTNASITGVGREFTGNRRFAEIRRERDKGNPPTTATSMALTILGLNTKVPDIEPTIGLPALCGITIRTSTLEKVEPASAQATKAYELLQREFAAQQEKKVLTLQGEGAAAAIRVKGQAEADVIGFKGKAAAESLRNRLEVLKEHGQLGMLLAQMDAMSAENPNKTVIWANNPFLQAQTGLVEALNAAGITNVDALRTFVNETMKQGAA